MWRRRGGAVPAGDDSDESGGHHGHARGPALGADRYLALMRIDKKSEGGEIRFVLLQADAGDARGQDVQAVLRAAPEDAVRATLAACGAEG